MMTEVKDRFASFRTGGSDRFGVVTADGVIDLTDVGHWSGTGVAAFDPEGTLDLDLVSSNP